MNKKLFGDIIFYTVGTFIIAVMLVIVTLNFAKDARMFQLPEGVVAEGSVDNTASSDNQKEGIEEQFKTFKYERAPDAVPDTTKDYGEDTPKSKSSSSPSPNLKKIKIEVINYTSSRKLTKDLKTTLEAQGFEVSVREEKSKTRVSTTIIERNDKKAGTEVLKVLKAGKVIKWPDPKSKFDVTVKIGPDYLP